MRIKLVYQKEEELPEPAVPLNLKLRCRRERQEPVIAILYPDIEAFKENYNIYAYRNLSNEQLDYINTLWESLKIN